MSFDLYVWASAEPVTAEQAERICVELAEENARSVRPDVRVQDFTRDLMLRFPALESMSDEGIEASPWSMTPWTSTSHVIMTIVWSQAQEMAEFVRVLAAGHGLVCCDPQASIVHNPPGQALVEELRLEFCDGGVVDRPHSADLRPLLQRISARNWYACLEGWPGWFVQVGIGPNAGNVPAGRFALESREGSPERHYRTLVASLDDVVAAFEGFASGDQSWKAAYSWARV